MRNTNELKSLIKSQPKENWTTGVWGTIKEAPHCKLGWVLWNLDYRLTSCPFMRLTERYDMTDEQYISIISLNDCSYSSEEATKRIIAYIDSTEIEE